MAGADARHPGAIVVSLDFELAWGVRRRAAGGYAPNLHGERVAIPRLLALFEEQGIAATWATVGFLFAESREELSSFSPPIEARPAYAKADLSPYDDPIGEGEADDPLHYGLSMIERIRATPRQEIATHTFSHYYCLAQGQTPETFRADLRAALAIARRRGIEVSSIVFPRNQHNPACDPILRELGITAYRGNPRSWMWRFAGTRNGSAPSRRAARLLDSYVDLSGAAAYPWSEVLQPNGLSDVRASAFLRPTTPRGRHLEPLRLRRIEGALRGAAQRGEIYHLWWHPHNFGRHPEENLGFLGAILGEFARLRDELGMRSLSMAEVDRAVRAGVPGERMAAPAARPIF